MADWDEWGDEGDEVDDGRVPPGATPVIPSTLMGPGETCGGETGVKRKAEDHWMTVLGIAPRNKRMKYM